MKTEQNRQRLAKEINFFFLLSIIHLGGANNGIVNVSVDGKKYVEYDLRALCAANTFVPHMISPKVCICAKIL